MILVSWKTKTALDKESKLTIVIFFVEVQKKMFLSLFVFLLIHDSFANKNKNKITLTWNGMGSVLV